MRCLQLIRQTEGALQDASATRSVRHVNGTGDPVWQRFYQMALVPGEIQATVVIDFEYLAPKGTSPHGHPTVERMYCFDDGGESRVVLHVHTLEPWPGYLPALAADPTTRAKKVTAINFRHGTLNPAYTTHKMNPEPKFLQGARGLPLVAVSNWQGLVSNARGDETEWSGCWGPGGGLWHPPLEVGQELPLAVWHPPLKMAAPMQDAYHEVRFEASFRLPFPRPIE